MDKVELCEEAAELVLTSEQPYVCLAFFYAGRELKLSFKDIEDLTEEYILLFRPFQHKNEMFWTGLCYWRWDITGYWEASKEHRLIMLLLFSEMCKDANKKRNSKVKKVGALRRK